MSIKIMTNVWEHSSQKGSRLLLLLAIADHANDEGIGWPGQESLAKKTRMSKRQVQRNITALVEDGELEILDPGGRGPKSTPRYRVCITSNKGDILTQSKGDISDNKGDTLSNKGDISDNKGDIAMSSEPSIEPSIESSGEPIAPPSGGDEPYENPFNLYEAMCNQLGISVEALPRPQMMKQLGVAKRLAKSGVTSTEVQKITAWLQSQSWLTSGIDMLVVDKNYAKWILSGKTGAKPTSSKAPVITEDDPYQVRAYLGNGPWEIGTDEHGEPIFTSDLRTYYEHKFPEAL